MKRHSLAPLLLLLLFAALPTLGASGDLDRSYGNGGFVFGSNADASTTLAIQPDDKVIAGGQCRVNGQSHFCLMRYLSNGAVDTSFGTGGQVYTPILTGASIARRLVVLPNGKILAVGYTSIPGNYPDEISYQFALARYNANGTLDPSFDGDGIVVNPIMTYRGAFAVDVAVQPDGKYVAAGGGTYPGKDFVAVRVNEDGSFDQSFGSAGIVTIATSYGSAQCVALQPDGKIVLGGWGGVSVHAVVARLTTAGVLDVSFNGSGILTYEVGYTSLRRMFVRPDGKILALGSGQPNIGSGNYLEIARINSNGTMDTTYDGDGIFFSTSSQGVPSRANDFLLQPDGKIVAAGNLSLNGNSYSASARYQADIPQLDNQFGDRGKILRLTTFDSTSVVMQSDGRLIFGGTRAVGPSAFQFFLVRHLNNGTRDADFDNDRKSDLSVFRPSTGTWYLSGSTNGDTAVQFGS
ncbi:MAG: delta-60 repeat domain-containing protein, partial [Pyrinomonadaceae bacterium]